MRDGVGSGLEVERQVGMSNVEESAKENWERDDVPKNQRSSPGLAKL
jgi:hypothetical protein